MKAGSNPFDSPDVALGYEDWYQTTGKAAARQEKALLEALLRQADGVKTILDVGCGTGYFTGWYQQLGLSAVGLDRSRLMIQQAQQGHGVLSCLGDAQRLPFPAKAFDLVSFITTLEFLCRPGLVIKEGQRVARRGLLLGVINRHSFVGSRYRKKDGPIWGSAVLYTPAELIQMVTINVPDPHKVLYRTTLWPFVNAISRLPWGGFIGMLVILKSSER